MSSRSGHLSVAVERFPQMFRALFGKIGGRGVPAAAATAPALVGPIRLSNGTLTFSVGVTTRREIEQRIGRQSGIPRPAGRRGRSPLSRANRGSSRRSTKTTSSSGSSITSRKATSSRHTRRASRARPGSSRTTSPSEIDSARSPTITLRPPASPAACAPSSTSTFSRPVGPRVSPSSPATTVASNVSRSTRISGNDALKHGNHRDRPLRGARRYVGLARPADWGTGTRRSVRPYQRMPFRGNASPFGPPAPR